MWCVGVNSFSYDGRIKLLVLFHISHVSLTVFIVLRTSRNFFFYLRNISEFILALSETKLNEALKHICLHNWTQPNQWIFIFKCCWNHLQPLNTKCKLSMEICNDNSIVLSLMPQRTGNWFADRKIMLSFFFRVIDWDLAIRRSGRAYSGLFVCGRIGYGNCSMSLAEDIFK